MSIEKKEKSITWFSVTSSFKIKTCESPNNRIRHTYWIKQTDSGKTHTTFYNNTYNIYDYEILNKSLKPSAIRLSRWKIDKFFDQDEKHAFNGMYARFTDPKGEIRNFMVHSFESALSFLQKFSDYENWESYELNEKYEKVLKQYNSLKEDYDEQTIKVDSFRKTKLFDNLKEAYKELIIHSDYESKIGSFCRKHKIDREFMEEWLIKK